VNAVILAHLQPIFIILMGFLLLKTDTLHAYDYSGIFILILSGVLVTSGTIDRMIHLNFGTMGDAFVLIATFTWAITALITRKYLTHLDASVITFYRFFLASLVFVFLIPFVQLQPNIYQVIVGVVVGVGTISYYAGLKRLKAAQVSGLELAAPVFASVIGYCVLHEPITLLQGIGILLLFLGIFFISRKETHGFVT
jgi:drug/metabolite transporter (DMT)-like permease